MSKAHDDILSLPAAARFDAYCGPWAMDEHVMRVMVGEFRGNVLRRHVEESRHVSAEDAPQAYALSEDGVAIVQLTGTLMKHETSLGSSTSTVNVRRSIRQAVSDEDVKSIMLVIDSPGGTVAGTSDLAQDVAMAARQKPVHAYISDLGASAAYWIASQASRITANETALVGSIGTLSVINDTSKAYEEAGVTVHVIKTGAVKGAGTQGSAVTDEHLAYFQSIVDGLQKEFSKSVATGRKVKASVVSEWADGRVVVASAAKAMGMIDNIGSLDVAIAELHSARKPRVRKANATVLTLGNGWTASAPELPESVFELFAPVGEDRAADPELSESPITRAEENPMSNSETAAVAPENTLQAPPAPVTAPPVATAPVAASFAELKAACTGADADFFVDQLTAGVTVAQARDNWMAEQNRRIAVANEATKAAHAAAGNPGVDALGSSGSDSDSFDGDPISLFESAVADACKTSKNRRLAVRKVVIAQPELHRAYVESYNAENKIARA